jgi:hypothetical protein
VCGGEPTRAESEVQAAETVRVKRAGRRESGESECRAETRSANEGAVWTSLYFDGLALFACAIGVAGFVCASEVGWRGGLVWLSKCAIRVTVT